MMALVSSTLFAVTLVCCIGIGMRNNKKRKASTERHNERTKAVTEKFSENPELVNKKAVVATGNASSRLQNIKKRRAARKQRWEESQHRVRKIGAKIVD